MTARYQVQIYDTSGQRQAVLTSWNSLDYHLRVNNWGEYQISIPLDDPNVEHFVTDAIILILRADREAGLDWNVEFAGLHRTPQETISEASRRLFTSYGRSLEDLLRRRIVTTYPNTLTLNTVSGETALKELVNRFGGPLRTGGSQLIEIVPPSLENGDLWGGVREKLPLLDILREIANTSGVDFNVTISFNPLERTFNTYFPQLGLDRSESTGETPTILGPERGNARIPLYIKSRTEEATVAIVRNGGALSGSASSPAALDSPWNDIEVYEDSTDTYQPYLDIQAEAAVKRAAAKEAVQIEVIQLPSCLYGRDYAIGDIVTVRFRSHVLDTKITGVHVTVREAGENIRLDFGELDPIPTYDDVFRGIVHRLRRLEAK